jgi:hypothetical protein
MASGKKQKRKSFIVAPVTMAQLSDALATVEVVPSPREEKEEVAPSPRKENKGTVAPSPRKEKKEEAPAPSPHKEAKREEAFVGPSPRKGQETVAPSPRKEKPQPIMDIVIDVSERIFCLFPLLTFFLLSPLSY